MRRLPGELRADAIIEGAVLYASGRVRITAQLIDPLRDRHLWADTYERDARDVLAMQADVASAIASAVRQAVVPAAPPRERARRVVPEARDAYLRGRYAWNRRTEAEVRKAIHYFAEASRLDPNDPLPFAGLADALTALGYFSYLSPQESFVPARRSAERAIALDGSLAEPYASRAYVRLYYDWDFPGAEKDFRQALTLGPAYATGHQWYAVYLSALRRFEAARTELARARTLDPYSLSVMTDMGWQLYLQRDYQGAAESLRRTLTLDDRFPLAHFWLGRTLQQQQRHAEAVAEFEKTVAGLPGSIVALVQLAHAQAVAGHVADARRTLALIEARGASQYVTSYGRALIFTGLGERDAALEWLERAVEERSHWLVWLPLDPRWDALRDERRFRGVAGRVGVPPDARLVP